MAPLKAVGALRGITPRHWLALGLAVALLGLAVGLRLVAQAPPATAPTGVLHLVDGTSLLVLQGDVQLQRVGAASLEPVAGQQALQVGDRVRTGANGYATILYFDGSTTTLDPNSELVLQRFERDPTSGATAIIVQQPLGSSWTRAVDGVHPFSGFLLANTTGRFFARGSQFAADAAPEGMLSIAAVEGTVFGRAQSADVEVPAGFAARVEPGQPPEPALPATPHPFTLQVRVDGPVRALLTDARGRSMGYHPQAEPYVAQIPYARLTSAEGGAQVFTIPGPVEEYHLTLHGTTGGEVSIAVGVLRAGEVAAPAQALLRGPVAAGEVQTTSFQWGEAQVRGLQGLSVAAGPPPSSAVVLLRTPPVALALVPTATPAPAATSEAGDEGEGAGARPPLTEPGAAEVFAGLDVPPAPLRPLVVAPAAPERPAALSRPPAAPTRPPVISQAPGAPPRAPAQSAVVAEPEPPPASSPEAVPTAAPTRAAPPPTAEVRVVTATPPPPTPVPPTPIPPTPPPPTPRPPTPEPTVPPALPTPAPTAAPTRAVAPRATVASQRPAIAPTATPVPALAPPPGGSTR